MQIVNIARVEELIRAGASAEQPHSPLGASSFYRWETCPGSVRKIASLPPEMKAQTSPAAEEGTLAHFYLTKVLSGLGSIVEVPRDNEMRDAIQWAVDNIRYQVSQDSTKTYTPQVWLEHSFDLGSVYPGCFGTADIVIYNIKTKILRVIDYKHGAGLLVEAGNEKMGGNTQLLYYALGAVKTLPHIKIKQVDLQVLQPRCEHPSGTYARSWLVDPMEVFDFSTRLKKACKETEREDAPLVPGDHCRFCPAKGVCEALQNQAMAVAKTEFSRIDDKGQVFVPPPVTVDQVEKALKWVEPIMAWAKAVKAAGYQYAMAGKKLEGYKLVEKRAQRKWLDANEAAQVLEKIGKPHQIYETKLKSPAQIEKALRLTAQECRDMESLIKKESSGYALVPDTDRRKPALIGAKHEFEVVDSAG